MPLYCWLGVKSCLLWIIEEFHCSSSSRDEIPRRLPKSLNFSRSYKYNRWGYQPNFFNQNQKYIQDYGYPMPIYLFQIWKIVNVRIVTLSAKAANDNEGSE